MPTHGLIGDALIHAGVIDAEGLVRAVAAQAKNPATLGRTIANLGGADEAVVARTIAAALRLDFFDGTVSADDSCAALLPLEFCQKRSVLPLGLDRNRLRIAMTNPLDHSVLQDVEFRTGRTAVAVVVTQTWLEAALGVAGAEAQAAALSYERLDNVTPAGEVESAVEELDLLDPTTLAKDTNLPPIVRLVNLILSEAAAAGASDIHIEPQETLLQIRHRVDGLLREVLTIPHHLQDQTISRFKIMSGMDIAERRKPQDGRSRLRFGGRRIDLRVSTLPTQYGEKVVIRLLNSEGAIPPLEAMGFSPDNLLLMRSFLSRPQGMILVTGPTGSGKTSTLYTALKSVKSPTNNIITLEDPIELQLPGVNQMQVNVKAGVTFAAGLRSILRQDPNIILVGEIRDAETAGIALQAAQTGHLMLSTLHTNDATATITRLLDLDIQPFMIASSLVGIVSQRLVRKICPSCKVPRQPSAEAVEKIGGASRLPPGGQWAAGAGCKECGGLGLKGRLPIHEILQLDDEIRALISSRASEAEIRTAARRAGMRTLLEDGIDKAAQGATTLDEVLSVAAVEPAVDAIGRARSGGEPPAIRSEPGSAPAPPVAAIAAEGAVPGAAGRVLIVEDSPTIVAVVKYFLELEGFEVLVAGDGRKGLEMALSEQPDMIVSDVSMPMMTGLEMVRALRADTRSAGIRILMLTSEASAESEAQGLEAGADDYILKPVEPRRLAARVKALMGRPRGRAA
jgi:type IV pilus assembly protein PilB